MLRLKLQIQPRGLDSFITAIHDISLDGFVGHRGVSKHRELYSQVYHILTTICTIHGRDGEIGEDIDGLVGHSGKDPCVRFQMAVWES